MRIFLIALLFLSTRALAQDDYPYADAKTGYLHISKYDKFKKGDTITIGHGTMPSKDFQYLNVTLAKIPLSSFYAGRKAVIKGFNYQGNSKQGFKFYCILGGEKFNDYEVDIKNAIASGEVVSKDPDISITSRRSIADEITALRKLVTDGTITIEEFEKGKKKILE